MSSMSPMVKMLIDLTNADKVQWKRTHLNINESKSDDWIIRTELLQDDQPYLEIHDISRNSTFDENCVLLRGYNHGIQELDLAITEQYRRRKLFEFNEEYKKNIEEIEKRRLEEALKNAEKIRILTQKFKQEFGNRRPR